MEFRIHEDAREEWERLRSRLGVAVARRWYADLCAWLDGHDGIPPDAAPDEGVQPPIFWLLFGEASTFYVLRDTPPRPRGWWDVRRHLVCLWRGRGRRAVFVGFGEPWPPLTPG